MNVIEQAKDIIATLEYFVNFTEPDEVEEDYAQRIREAYELLVEHIPNIFQTYTMTICGNHTNNL